MPIEASLLCLTPGEARGSCARVDRCVEVGEAKLAGGGGKEVKRTEHDVAPWRESLVTGAR